MACLSRLSMLLCLMIMMVPGQSLAGVEVLPAQVNRWHQARTATAPVDLSAAPAMLRSILNPDQPFVAIYRLSLLKGRKYTFQGEYPADGRVGAACLRGVNPLAASDHSPAPEGTTNLALCLQRVFPRGDVSGQVFGFRESFTVAPQSRAGEAFLIFSSRDPGTDLRFRLLDPALPDSEISEKGNYIKLPDGSVRHSWSSVNPQPLYLGYSADKPAPAGPAPTRTADRSSPRSLSGRWQVSGAKNKPYLWLDLRQEGPIITGRARYGHGQASVRGRLTGNRLELKLTYDNVQVLAKWLPRKVAAQVVGISSPLVFDLTPGEGPFQGTLESFYVWWDGSRTVTRRADGGTAMARAKTRPNPQVLSRIKAVDQPRDMPVAATGVKVRTLNPAYRPGQAIEVEYSGLPGNNRDWLTVVARGTPDHNYGQWFYTQGRRQGQLSFEPLSPGDYEVRIYLDWPNGGYDVAARRSFTVAAGQAAATARSDKPAIIQPGADFSGRWQVENSKGEPYMTLDLEQQGSAITGRARYSHGSALVRGVVSFNRLELKLIYDNVKVLAKWLPAKVAEQVVGISSPLTFDLAPGGGPYQGRLDSFYVWWDGNEKVTKRADGGSDAALAKSKSWPQTLRRPPGAATPPPSRTVDVSGSWELLDKDGKPYVSLDLTQEGRTVIGQAEYKIGRATVKGLVEGDRLILDLVYDNAEVLTNWLSQAKAEQSVGISSRAVFELKPGADLLKGEFQGFWLRTDGSGKVTHRYSGGSETAAKYNPPGPRGLRRAAAPAGRSTGAGVEKAIDWQALILSGQSFRVVLDQVGGKFDDTGYTGDWRTDPLGNLKAGETYAVVYRSGKFTVTGFNEQRGRSVTHTDGGADPKRHRISLWGRVMEFDEAGRVRDAEHGLVGRLVKVTAPGGSGKLGPHPVAERPGPGQLLVQRRIGPEGGRLVVDKPGDPLHGLSIDIPAGAFLRTMNFTVRRRSVPAGIRRGHVNPVTPLIEVSGARGYAARLMTVRFPVDPGPDAFAMPFFVDPETGRLEGMPVLGVDNGQLVAVTRHFSSFFVSRIARDVLLGRADIQTGFTPGRDNWGFVNRGSVVSPRGICSGMTLTAGWYYLSRFKNGAPGLQQTFDNHGRSFTTPDYGRDDGSGLKWASMVQLSQNTYSNRTGYTVLDEWRKKRPTQVAEAVWLGFAYSMLVTGEPQYISIQGYDQDKGRWYGHALLAYAMDLEKGELKIYDPNYDPSQGRTVSYDPAARTFKRYLSASNADRLKAGKGLPFTVFYYFAKSAVVDWPTIGGLFRLVNEGTIGQGKFPNWWLDVVDDQNRPLTRLADGAKAAGTGLRLRPGSDSQPYKAAFRFFRAGEPMPGVGRPTASVKAVGGWVKEGRIAEIPLDPGLNTIGVEVVGWDSEGRGPDWVGFGWFRVTAGPGLTINPAQVTGRVGTPLSFSVRAEAMADEPDYTWDWGDGARTGTGRQTSAAHTWQRPGDYKVLVSMRHRTDGRVLATAEARVKIQSDRAAAPAAYGDDGTESDGCTEEQTAKCRATNYAGLECLKCRAGDRAIQPGSGSD